MVDAHCHLVDPRYISEELSGVISRANEAGIIMVSNGTGLKNSKTTVEIAETNNNIWACVGLAYDRSSDNFEKKKTELRKLCQSEKVVGIGEAGLDYFEGMSEELKKYQKLLLNMHIELANEVNLPLQIHNRRADEDLIQILDKARVPVMMHCFNRDIEFMRKCLTRDWYISIGGLITYKNAKKLNEVAKLVPINRLLTETDAPYLAPEPIKGSVNEPKNVKIIISTIAQIRGLPVDELSQVLNENLKTLFYKIK